MGQWVIGQWVMGQWSWVSESWVSGSWVIGSWVSGLNGSQLWIGHMGTMMQFHTGHSTSMSDPLLFNQYATQ